MILPVRVWASRCSSSCIFLGILDSFVIGWRRTAWLDSWISVLSCSIIVTRVNQQKMSKHNYYTKIMVTDFTKYVPYLLECTTSHPEGRSEERRRNCQHNYRYGHTVHKYHSTRYIEFHILLLTRPLLIAAGLMGQSACTYLSLCCSAGTLWWGL